MSWVGVAVNYDASDDVYQWDRTYNIINFVNIAFELCFNIIVSVYQVKVEDE